MLPLMTGERASIRDWALAGVWGREVHLIDADAKYARAPSGDNAPLSLWSNRWSTMPIHHMPQLQMPPPDERAVLDRMPGATDSGHPPAVSAPAICCRSGRWASSAAIICIACATIPAKKRTSRAVPKKNERRKNFAPL